MMMNMKISITQKWNIYTKACKAINSWLYNGYVPLVPKMIIRKYISGGRFILDHLKWIHISSTTGPILTTKFMRILIFTLNYNMPNLIRTLGSAVPLMRTADFHKVVVQQLKMCWRIIWIQKKMKEMMWSIQC